MKYQQHRCEMTEATYKVNHRQAKEMIGECIEAGLVPFIQSSPGTGKSSLFEQAADSYNLQLIDHRLSTSVPEDLNGLPSFVNGKATFSPFDIFPMEDTPIPKGKAGFFLFFDEFNSASKMVQAAAYKTILDKFIGQRRLHPNTAIGAAGNLATDRAIVNALSTAMQSRLINFELEIFFAHFVEDVMIPRHWDKRIVAFLHYKESAINNFRPDHSDRTFACPRTWEFLSKLIKGKEIKHEKLALYAGAIGVGAALDFVNFCEVYKDLPKVDDILREPNSIPVPSNTALKWATIAHVVDKSTNDNFEKLVTYVSRFDSSFRVLFFRFLLKTKPQFRTHPGFAKAMMGLAQYFND